MNFLYSTYKISAEWSRLFSNSSPLIYQIYESFEFLVILIWKIDYILNLNDWFLLLFSYRCHRYSHPRPSSRRPHTGAPCRCQPVPGLQPHQRGHVELPGRRLGLHVRRRHVRLNWAAALRSCCCFIFVVLSVLRPEGAPGTSKRYISNCQWWRLVPILSVF